MKRTKYLIGYCILLPLHSSISIVYNLRVAETSKRVYIEELLLHPSLATATLFDTFRKKYNGTKHNCIGGLFTLMYAPELFFLRVDAAVGHVSSNTAGVHFDRTQTDDILFSAGYSPRMSKKMRLTFSGLFGIPTHKDTSLEYVQLGFGHYGLGAQLDGAFACSQNKNVTLRCAARLIHFFPTHVRATITSTKKYNYNIGNLSDLFIALHYKKAAQSIEGGYNPEFFFNATMKPSFYDTIKKANYIRHSFYGLYKYRFSIHTLMNMIAFALSYGFEPTPKIFGNKQIWTTWASWSINF